MENLSKRKTMKITEVYYERLFKTQQFENERIGFTATVSEGEDPNVILEALKVKVITSSTAYAKNLVEAQEVLKNKRKHTGIEVEWAGKVLKGETTSTKQDYVDFVEADEDYDK
jgi:hypothetical protein